ncbi:MAG: FixH family protein [Pirellula staleyi]
MMANLTQTEQYTKKTERNSRAFWILMILGFFAIDLAIAAIAITMAAGDPSFRSIPGYGERAVAWDERQALRDAWQNRQWHIAIQRVGNPSDAIEVAITDRNHEPVSGCVGSARLFHYTRVAQQVSATLSEIAPGRYQAKVDVAKLGLWSFELTLTSPDGQRCSYEQAMEWNEPPAAAPRGHRVLE